MKRALIALAVVLSVWVVGSTAEAHHSGYCGSGTSTGSSDWDKFAVSEKAKIDHNGHKRGGKDKHFHRYKVYGHSNGYGIQHYSIRRCDK